MDFIRNFFSRFKLLKKITALAVLPVITLVAINMGYIIKTGNYTATKKPDSNLRGDLPKKRDATNGDYKQTLTSVIMHSVL